MSVAGGTMRSSLLRTLKRGRVASAPSSSSSFGVSTSRRFMGTLERIGPEMATDRGLAAEQGQLPRRWIDEPVPATSMSAMKEFPGVPPGSASKAAASPRVRVSTLPNGLRVSTQDTYGQVSTFAMFVDAGSMYEAEEEVGACHFLETTAFKGTKTKSAADVLEFQSRQGIGSSAVFNREVVMFKVDTLRSSTGAALELLADAVMRPAFSPEEMDNARRVIQYQREEALSQPAMLVTEHLYTAAYGEGTPLGRPEKCSEERALTMTDETLRRYQSKYFTAPRMVLSAVNVDHDAAVEAAKTLFADLPTKGAVGAREGRVVCPYVGGDVRSSPDWSAVPATAAGAQAASKTGFTHLMLAFPTVGWSHDDVVPICLVDTLLGGGSSFSAGGPGKGMYSRLYREVLNMDPAVEVANAFSAQLYDCGIVGVYGATAPAYAGHLTETLAGHLLRLCEQPVGQDELRRSANQLASSVLMNLETRGLLAEDIGRQILSHGKRLDPSELVQRIRAVNQDDIIRVMRSALSAPPSFAAVGDVSKIAEYGRIRDVFASRAARWNNSVPGSTSLRMRSVGATIAAAAGKVISAASASTSSSSSSTGGGKGK